MASPEKRSKAPIQVRGARVHNLKNIDLDIPKDKLVVITGVSGSGKSSLAFDTLYAEGQRRYIESLSAYIRQFMGRLEKPDVDDIQGIAPAIAIQQKVVSKNPRSTVGTSTEIHDYLKLLFARIGRTFSPVSGEEVKKDTVTDVVDFLNSNEKGTKAAIYSPLVVKEGRTLGKELEVLSQQGFTRIKRDNEVLRIEDLLEKDVPESAEGLRLVVDRVKVDHDDESNNSRIADSVQTAFYEGHGTCWVEVVNKDGKNEFQQFSDRAEKDGITFETPTVNFFSFNSPLGACPTCEGFGQVMGIDDDLVIPNKDLSVYEGALVCWNGEKMSRWKDKLLNNAHKFDFPVHRPIKELTDDEYNLLWEGNEYFKGLNAFFEHLEKKSYKIQYRVMLSRYRGRTLCPDCNGKRLRKDAEYVKVGGFSIQDLIDLPAGRLKEIFNDLDIPDHDREVATRLLYEIESRLQYLCDVGLHYLTLNRLSNTLSGGENQRIDLSRSLGSSLVGSIYILDEPSIGLHPRDNDRLMTVLKGLRDLGNTVIVVEHDEEMIRDSDMIIDLGPEAGAHGGEVVFKGSHDELLEEPNSLTTQYLTGKKHIPVPTERRISKGRVVFKGVRENNLKGFDAELFLGTFNLICGVSGSGKSTLVKTIIAPSIKRKLEQRSEKPGNFDGIEGDLRQIEQLEFVDQSPIGRSSRSNPVTYVKGFDEIRELFAAQNLSKIRDYKPKTFSFNVDGGRCDVCEGEGTITVEMQFMADIELTCDACKGRRYKEEVLEVEYRDMNIAQVLELTVDEAIATFSGEKDPKEEKLIQKLQPLQEVGLGYVKLGQPSSTLSGGEAQRIKLASFLSKKNSSSPTLFIFDEPTTGLHFHDIQKLLYALDALIEQGHTVLVIEHHPDMIKRADHLMDLGPEGGDEGGYLVFSGTPEELVDCKSSYTAKYLKNKLGEKEAINSNGS